MLNALPKIERPTKVVRVPCFDTKDDDGNLVEASVEIREMNIKDGLRYTRLMEKAKSHGFAGMIAAGLMCAMGDGQGGYLVPEDDRLEEMLNLSREALNILYPPFTELNPLHTESLAAKKKSS